jgi:hypothetical protein
VLVSTSRIPSSELIGMFALRCGYFEVKLSPLSM